MCLPGQPPPGPVREPATATEAVAMARAALAWLARAGPAALSASLSLLDATGRPFFYARTRPGVSLGASRAVQGSFWPRPCRNWRCGMVVTGAVPRMTTDCRQFAVVLCRPAGYRIAVISVSRWNGS
jgi:hypothetical protein